MAISELAAIRKQKKEEDRLKRWEEKQIAKEDERRYGRVYNRADLTPKEAMENMKKRRLKTAG
jgi:hypothetical protein